MLTSQLTGFDPLPSTSPVLYTWQITDDTRIRLRRGSAGFLLAHAAASFDSRVEDIDDNYRNGELDDWGHAFRAVRGYVELSRHAYGLAEDLNATDHPLGVHHTFTPRQVEIIHRRLRKYDGCIRWGGDYESRVDPMHLEVDRPLADCERVARKLMGSHLGRELLEANPGQRAVILS
jgi:hypothetical protein